MFLSQLHVFHRQELTARSLSFLVLLLLLFYPTTDAKTLPGISQPFPDMFDPLNFTKGARVKDVRRWRESELVHGRVAMLAALGFIVGEQLEDIPAFLNADGHITGPAIYQFQQVEARGAVFVSIFPTFSTVYLAGT